jgi:hypothetical protein
MSNVVALARGALAMQMALAGLRVEQPEPGDPAETVLDEILREPGQVTLVIVQDDYRRKFSEWFRDRLSRHKTRPLVVYCPESPGGDGDVDAYITSVLKPALGFEIRLE